MGIWRNGVNSELAVREVPSGLAPLPVLGFLAHGIDSENGLNGREASVNAGVSHFTFPSGSAWHNSELPFDKIQSDWCGMHRRAGTNCGLQ